MVVERGLHIGDASGHRLGDHALIGNGKTRAADKAAPNRVGLNRQRARRKVVELRPIAHGQDSRAIPRRRAGIVQHALVQRLGQPAGNVERAIRIDRAPDALRAETPIEYAGNIHIAGAIHRAARLRERGQRGRAARINRERAGGKIDRGAQTRSRKENRGAAVDIGGARAANRGPVINEVRTAGVLNCCARVHHKTAGVRAARHDAGVELHRTRVHGQRAAIVEGRFDVGGAGARSLCHCALVRNAEDRAAYKSAPRRIGLNIHRARSRVHELRAIAHGPCARAGENSPGIVIDHAAILHFGKEAVHVHSAKSIR